MWQTYFKQDNKIVSIGTLLLRSQFYFQYHMNVSYLLVNGIKFYNFKAKDS